MTLIRDKIVECHSLEMGGMALVRTPSMRYFTTTSMSRASMWMSLARRSSRVHQANDGAYGRIPGELVAKESLGALFFFLNHLQGKGFRSLLQHALGLLGTFEQVADLGGSCDPQNELLPQE
jgi:hypothetical protein